MSRFQRVAPEDVEHKPEAAAASSEVPTEPESSAVELEPPPPQALSSEEIDQLKHRNSMLERELEGYKRIVNEFDTPPGYEVETITVGIGIERSNSGVAESPGSATLFQFKAKNKELDWESTQIDQETAVRACWNHALDLVKKERDELKRRWDQRKATLESKQREEEKDEEAT